MLLMAWIYLPVQLRVLSSSFVNLNISIQRRDRSRSTWPHRKEQSSSRLLMTRCAGSRMYRTTLLLFSRCPATRTNLSNKVETTRWYCPWKERDFLTLWTPEAGIPAARYINATARSRYTGGTVINATGQKPVYQQHGSQRHRPEAGIPDLFSNAYWHRNARVIEIQTRQQLKNNYFHQTAHFYEQILHLDT